MADAAGDGPAGPARLAELDDALRRLEELPGPTGELALDAVAMLAAVYGEALGRAVSCAAEHPDVVRALVRDDLVGHLLALHGVHPVPVHDRVRQALDEVRPYLQSQGGDVELAELEGGVARVRLTGGRGGCGSSAADVEQAVRDAVLTYAPELTDVEQLAASRSPALIPVEALLRRPAEAGRRTA